MLLIALAQSDANRNEVNMRSDAKARPSLQMITSTISGYVIPSRTTPDAPRKRPFWSRAMAATDALLKFFGIAASTFIFMHPTGGGSHRGC